MNEQQFRDIVSGQSKSLSDSLMRGLLWCTSSGYSSIVRVRNRLYDRGICRVHRAAVPVISIGNLTTGGTGKTPMVACVVRLLQQSGRRPAIVSRGYRAGADGTNDEKRVLDQQCPGVPHVQNPDRVAAVAKLLQASDIDAIVMDDGFQHRRLHRDQNIVLIDATNPFGYGYILPRGLLREPLSGLNRADTVVITRADLVDEATLNQIETTVVQYAPHLKARIFRVRFSAAALLDVSGTRTPLESLQHRCVYLMSGIGNPAAFESTCNEQGVSIKGHRRFGDHHHYTEADLQSVRDAANRAGAEALVTTLKDLVKLPATALDFLAIEIAAHFDPPAAEATVLTISNQYD